MTYVHVNERVCTPLNNKDMGSRDWIVRISHAYKEANRLANGLANYAFTLQFGLHYLGTVPENVASIMLESLNEVARTRQTSM